jgi:peptidoglycan/LPS O-acetylase OafA/YrhL
MSSRGPVPDASRRLYFIEGLRGLAALYVVLDHFCTMSDPRAFQKLPSYAPTWLQWLMAPLWHGHLAVASFIVMSGFCLQMSLLSGKGALPSLGSFFRKRARRILPPYYAALAFSIVICLTVTSTQYGMPFEQYLPVTTTNVLVHVFLIQNLNPDWMYKLNGALWSIATEAQLYLTFPLIVWLIRKIGRFPTLGLAALFSAGFLITFPEALKLYPWYFALFTLGAVAAHNAYRPWLKFGVYPKPAVAFAALCLFGCVVTSRLDFLVSSDICIGGMVASLLYAGALRPSYPFVRVLSSRPLVSLGAVSYSLYLFHHPLEQLVYVYHPSFVNSEASTFLYLLIAGLPFILIAVTAFWFFVERPFVNSRSQAPVALVHADEFSDRATAVS